MAKAGEKTYFKEIGKDGVEFTLAKPFSDPLNSGGLLSDIAAIYTLLPTPPAKVLDLGCGSGWTSNFYAKAGYDTTGVDISSDAIRAAKKRFTSKNKKLTYVCADYDGIKYEDKFDVAVFFDSLHHSEDELDGIKAAYKALKAGGVLILCEPGVGHSKSPSSLDAVERYGVNERDMPPSLSKKALKKSGFVSIHTYAYPALLHRATYKTFSGKRAILNFPPMRAVVSFILGTFARRYHGLVVAYKPE